MFNNHPSVRCVYRFFGAFGLLELAYIKLLSDKKSILF